MRGLELMAGHMQIAEKLRRGLRASVWRVDAAVDGEDLQRRETEPEESKAEASFLYHH